MHLYLTGPITKNKTARKEFDKVAAILRSAGHLVSNPFEIAVDNDGKEVTDWKTAMRLDLYSVLDVAGDEGALAIVSCEHQSSGMGVEIALASFLGVPVRPWQTYLEEKYL